ncbi:MAG: hypothetical protein QM489_03785 [Candidatus Izemoplasma sp.]
MKENRYLYLSIFIVFLAMLIFQTVHFLQIDSTYISTFDYQSLLYIPYTLGLLFITTIVIYLIPIMIMIEVYLLFVVLKKTCQFSLIRKEPKRFFQSFIQIKSIFATLQVIRC